MVNEEKVILMTRLASYEQGEGKKYVNITRYFRTDYITAQMLKSVIAGIVAFVTIIGVYLFYNFEVIMENVYNMDFVAFGKRIGSIFVVCMGVYLIGSYIIAVYRYSHARKSLKVYYANLKRLEKMN